MDWYVADKEYIAYLYGFDYRVGKVEYGDRLKLHVGIIVRLGKLNYYVPVSSPKPKHEKMSNSLDFHKIVDQDTGTLYAVININNMVPIPDKYITKLKYDKIQDFRSFQNDKEMVDYIYLLQKEKKIIDELEEVLKRKAQKLYNKYIQMPESSLAERCCNFILLQEKAAIYQKDK